MGSIFSAIASVIDTIISAIASVIMTMVNAVTIVIVSIFDIITDIVCCRCFGTRRTGRRFGLGRRRGAGLVVRALVQSEPVRQGQLRHQVNERADKTAREAAAAPNIIETYHSTITWARATNKSKALRAWRREWADLPHTKFSAAALQKPPSTTLNHFHKNYTGPRDVHTRIIQAMTGHGFFGDYYGRFVPSESTSCPCDNTTHQTRDHILAECPLLDEHRHHLHDASNTLSSPMILGTRKGLEALVKFIQSSRAFAKTATYAPDLVPENTQPPLPPDPG